MLQRLAFVGTNMDGCDWPVRHQDVLLNALLVEVSRTA